MAIISDNGLDVYPVCILYLKDGGDIEYYPALVEAVSRDEALGKTMKIGMKLRPDNVKEMSIKVGMSVVVDVDTAKIDKS